MAFSNIFFDDATFICYIGKTEWKLYVLPIISFHGLLKEFDPSFFNSIALLIVSSTPHPQLASILKASVCFLSSVTIAMSCGYLIWFYK
jgi:hypothetical protein